ncbi:MAG: hypothetical protein LAP40_14105 [Acidobacteriia bacterium]|nr:hypothetical protein [Terriglobia bacterium]
MLGDLASDDLTDLLAAPYKITGKLGGRTASAVPTGPPAESLPPLR